MDEVRDQRKRPRVVFSVHAIFETAEQQREDEQCVDISMSGIFLRTSEPPLPINTEGDLLIVLACGEERVEVRARCRVTRVVDDGHGGYGMGLEYLSIDSDSSIALYKMIKYQGGYSE